MKAGARAVLLGTLLGLASAPALAHEVFVGETSVQPQVLTVKTGERVEFRRAVNLVIHLQFGNDPRQHEVTQIPLTGSAWAIFHRPGTHPYVVHVFSDGQSRALNGVIDVVEDETHRWNSATCGVVVMDECIEP